MKIAELPPLSAIQKLPVLMIFDRDGTLVPIVDHPEQACMNGETRELLSIIAAMPGVKVGILSARDLNMLASELTDDRIILAGNYGLQMRFPGQLEFLYPGAARWYPLICQIKTELIHSLSPEEKVVIDDHRLSLCVHWHRTPPHMINNVQQLVEHTMSRFPLLKLRALPTSYEILPHIDWDKASALEVIENTIDSRNKECLRLYAGDSQMDEPGFHWANAHDGISIRVGSFVHSESKIQVDNPKELMALIRQLIAQRNTSINEGMRDVVKYSY